MSSTRTSHVPAPARTDVAPPPAREPDPHPSSGTLRLLGAGLAAGAGIYGITFVVTAGWEAEGRFPIALSGLLFQLGVFCLLAAMWRTRATGTTRLARTMLVVESVFLGVATLQSVLTLPTGNGEWSTIATVLDPFWPLSMLGMAIIGVKVAVAGRWRGALRVWPVVAETWIFVALPSLAIFGQTVGSVIAGAHFLVGYAALGTILAIRPELTRR
ncbi:hypothetical protein [Actinomycetospora soli]|uniref:hypothetical protein n=1 Tax=Actinomycetospora soli TaxID=2893887 RepID=UPI001E473B6B|nr:hypothetical protein [Actinomycetospora soli]MCD2185684.1 hypothetical protein [Actinomycetospora soli]